MNLLHDIRKHCAQRKLSIVDAFKLSGIEPRHGIEWLSRRAELTKPEQGRLAHFMEVSHVHRRD